MNGPCRVYGKTRKDKPPNISLLEQAWAPMDTPSLVWGVERSSLGPWKGPLLARPSRARSNYVMDKVLTRCER